ncbi:MAG: LysR family transcriptional regulator [Eubacteriales bacterium]|nr:LysR family transcriptional regulator [Eubacteriales bacterium]
MTIQQMRYIVEVGAWGSINRAAKNLFVSQPAISKAIRDLEKDLGIRIFNRNNAKRLQFTPEGKELLRYARELLKQVKQIEERFAEKSHREFLGIAVSSQHYTFVVRAMIDFMDVYRKSRYEFFLRESKTDQIIEDVYTHRSSLGILSLVNSTEKYMRQYLAGKELDFHELRRFRPHVFLRKGHPLENRAEVTLQDLAVYPYVCYEQDTDSQYFREEAIILKAEQSVQVLERATMNNIICNTDSYNIGTGYIEPSVTDHRLTSLPIRDLPYRLVVGWIQSKRVDLAPPEKEFIERCSRYCREN